MKVLLEKNGPLANIQINRPDKLNVLNQETISLLLDSLQSCNEDPQVQLIVLTGSGDRAFSAGGDVKDVYYGSLKKGAYESKYLDFEFDLNKFIMASEKIILSHTKGIVMGGGSAISLGGDFILADETTRFALPEIDLAMIPDVGLGFYVSKLDQAPALYLTLLGKTLTGSGMVDFGFASHYIKHSDWPLIYRDLEKINYPGKSRKVLTREIQTLLDSYKQDLESTDYKANQAFYEKHFSQASLEEIFLSLEKDPSNLARDILQALRSKCPIASYAVFYKYFAGKDWTREQTFNHDRRILEYCYNQGNMSEGIRSLLIDKDQAHFNPNRIEQVNPDEIRNLVYGS